MSEEATITDIYRAVIRLEATMAEAVARLEIKLDRISTDHEARLQRIERALVAMGVGV